MARAASPVSRADPALVGRRDELATLIAMVRSRGPGAVILGPGGSGRSRLLSEALDAAADDGARVESIQATRSSAEVPLGALIDLIPRDADRDDPFALMWACAGRFAERSPERPTVLGVDDAELLDPVSAALLLALARDGTATVIATQRAGRRGPDALVSLYKDAGAACVGLGRLDGGELRELTEAFVGGSVDRATARQLIEETGGDAVFLRELIRGALDSGAIERRGDLWTVVGRPEPSAALRAMAAVRMSELDPAERELVELLALGRRLADAEVEAMNATEASASAEVKGVVVADGRSVRLAQPLLGRIVRDGLSPPRALALRRRLITASQAEGAESDADALRLVRLRLHAGESLDATLLLRGSRAALVDGELALAGELARSALDRERSLPAALALARALRLSGHAQETAALLASVEDLAPDHAQVRAYAVERLGVLSWDLRRPEEVAGLLDRMGCWSADAEWRAFVDRLRVTLSAVSEGHTDVESARRFAGDEELPERSRRMSVAAYRLGLLFAGDGDRAAQDAFERPTEVRGGDDHALAELATLVFVAVETGCQWGTLEAHLEHVLEQASGARVRAAAGIAAFGLARLRLLRGELNEASRWLMEAEVHLSRRDPFNAMIGVRCATVGVAALAGDYDGAELALAGLETAIAAREPLAGQRPAVLCATARVQAMSNPASAARRLLADAASVAVKMPGLAPALAYEALRLRDPLAPGEVRRLVDGCRAPLAAAFGMHADARTARSGRALLAASDELARIGAARYAHEAAAEAAAAFLDEGRQDSARRAAARARQLHAAHQGAPQISIDGLDAAAIELTSREAQLVELAGQGLANAEIARRLGISVRTAETHLYRGMRKLGISDRRDL